MITLTADLVAAWVVVFCRVGSCLMIMPGFSNSRIPVQARLFLALAVSVAISPLVVPGLAIDLVRAGIDGLAILILSEMVFGFLIGLLGRVFFEALQFMATAIAALAGVGSMPGAPTIDDEPLPALSSFIMALATVLFFMTDQHLEVIKGLLASYGAVPVSTNFQAEASLQNLLKVFSIAFQLALQVSGPFIVFALIVNFLFGLMNKMIPQVAVYFISLPFVIAGGLFLLFAALSQMLLTFLGEFSAWLALG
ncbi:MAG: flagellar biosynthetic protein FliR [Pseudomonadota bacterium]